MEAGFLGETTNNVAELTGLLRGLQIATEKDHHQVILEGDSSPDGVIGGRCSHVETS
jgi:ribonuclease HI